MKSVDLMICRSGASTLAEVIACHVPAILVPFPSAAANHQYFNAKVLADAGCAQLVCEGENFAKRLQTALETITPPVQQTMREAYQKLTIPSPLQATQYITQLLIKL